MNIDTNADRDLCVGYGTCLRVGVFALGEEPGAADIDKVRLAAEARPTGAIAMAEPPHDAHA